MGRRKKNKWGSAYMNNRTFNDYYTRLKELCLNVFEWKGLPDTCDERFLELMLYENGYCLFFEDPELGYLTLGGVIGGRLDPYNIPIERRAIASNGYNKELTSENSVIVFNNYIHTPTTPSIQLFARRLTEIERAIDVNVKGQKTPKIILCDENQRLTMENLFMRYDGNVPFIFGDSSVINMDNVKSVDISSPYVATNLNVLKHQLWNEALTFIGIENSNEDKKERLVADEVGSNFGSVEAHRNVQLNARRQACDKINNMFGLNISVDFRSVANTVINKPGGEEVEL